MKSSKINTNKLWEYHFKNRLIVRDVVGRIIEKDKYNASHKFSWTIDHIKPLSMGGTDRFLNLMPVNQLTNTDKSNSFPIFVSNNKRVKIKNKKILFNKKYKDGYELIIENF